MTIFKTKDARSAFYIGIICVFSYIACYFARNLLGVVSPYMINEGIYDIQYIGLLSTTNMCFYAVGQLVNGIVGEKIVAKYMVSGGLLLTGIFYVMVAISDVKIVVMAAYSLSGFFLSMLYAPMMKVIAENTRPIHAIRCSIALTFASKIGAPLAGLVAAIFRWKSAFAVAGCFMIFMGITSFILFSMYEKAGIIKYNRIQKDKVKGAGIKVLVRHAIVKFSFVAMLTGIVRTSVVFWIPTYLSQHLGVTTAIATTVFTVITLVQSAAPFINMVLIFERLLKRNMNRMLILMFSLSTVSFLMMYVVSNAIMNIIFLCLAVLTASGASSVIWNAYCPSLKETGMVSSATGYLDCLSYAAAALANQLFANAVSDIGWGNLIIVWSVLMLMGVIVALPIRKKGA